MRKLKIKEIEQGIKELPIKVYFSHKFLKAMFNSRLSYDVIDLDNYLRS